jgi:hypothetical protein
MREGVMSMTSIKVLALREKRAEADKRNAEDAWRRAWWNTTMELGGTAYEDRATACALVVETTGQSKSWVNSRSRTGEAFLKVGLNVYVHQLPPRMAVELVSKKVELTDEVVQNLKDAETNGMSLREFSASISGKAWADTPAGASKETIEEIVAKQPELVGQLVARHDKASRAHDSEVLSRHERDGVSSPIRPEDWSSHVLTRLTLAVKELRRECSKPGDLTENTRATIEWALAELTAIKEGREFVGEIEAWLESSTT